MPDLNDSLVRTRYAGKHVAVAGSGHSALTALVAFADLVETDPGTHVSWLLRRGSIGDTLGGGEADQLPARGALGLRAAEAVRAGHIDTVTGFRTTSVEHDGSGRMVLESLDGRCLGPVDEVVVLAGFRSRQNCPRARAPVARRCSRRRHREWFYGQLATRGVGLEAVL